MSSPVAQRAVAASTPRTPSIDADPSRRGRRSTWLISGLLVAMALGLQAAPEARAETIVNYTFHVPASVQTNPCFPADVLNLNGDIHVVITSTAAASGSYRVDNHLNSQLSGVSITTGTKYVNSEDKNDEWYTGPLPAVHTQTYDFNLISQSGTPDYVT